MFEKPLNPDIMQTDNPWLHIPYEDYESHMSHKSVGQLQAFNEIAKNKLNYFDSISSDEETGASLKHLRHIKASLEKNNIQCLVYQPPKPDIIDTLADKTAIKPFALDPLGQAARDEKQAWFKIMQDMAMNFKRCLSVT